MSESSLKKKKTKRKLIIESSSSKSIPSSPLMSSKSLEMKLKSEPEDVDIDNENPEALKENLEKIKSLLQTRIENSKHLENILPSNYLQYDPSCIRKYSNFSFPKEYKKFCEKNHPLWLKDV
jgi:hypothetical protein